MHTIINISSYLFTLINILTNVPTYGIILLELFVLNYYINCRLQRVLYLLYYVNLSIGIKYESNGIFILFRFSITYNKVYKS